MSAVTVTNGIQITNEITIDHYELGAEAWSWDAKQQADFLTAFAIEIKTAEHDAGIRQIAFIAEKIRSGSFGLDAVRWLNDRLTEYLAGDA